MKGKNTERVEVDESRFRRKCRLITRRAQTPSRDEKRLGACLLCGNWSHWSGHD